MEKIVLVFRSMAYVGGLMAFAEFSHEAYEKGGFAGLWIMVCLVIFMLLARFGEDIFRK